MKSSWFRNTIVTSVLAALMACLIPVSAAAQERDRNTNDSPYYSQPQDDSYRSHDDSNRGRARDDSYRRNDDSYRGQDGSYRAQRPRQDQGYYREPSYSQPYGRPAFQQHRSVGKSVLIVGGSAAAGAGIGALAGGGKGAGIGAIVGGLGGFIYDRATANHNH
jgi:hypothetical protein